MRSDATRSLGATERVAKGERSVVERTEQGVHVAHFVIDGVVRSAFRPDRSDDTLDPDAIARAYLDALRQPRNAWSFEVELRPWVETF